MTTKRKAYVRPMPSTSGGKKLPFYRFYMLREGTAVPAVWFSLELMYGVYALKHGPEASGQFCGLPAKPNHRSTEPDCARRRAASYQNPGLNWRQKQRTSL